MSGIATIVGIGETEYSRASGRSELQLAAEAGLAAIRDAGLEPEAIDGLVGFTMDRVDELELQRCLGIPFLRWASRVPFGGVGCNSTVQQAAAAVASGQARAVLVWRALNGRSGARYGSPEASMAHGGRSGPHFHYSMGLDTGAKSYAVEHQDFLRRNGIMNEDLGRYVVGARAWAATNPRAIFHGQPLTLEQHQASRWIVEPWLRRYDCCLESDGAAALVVTHADAARGGPVAPVAILAATQGLGAGARIAYDAYRTPEERAAEADAVNAEIERQCGRNPREVDVALLYDAFSPGVLVQMEAYGLCAPGEARALAAAGEMGPGGGRPVNPHGGMLGEAYVHGLNNVVEAVRQLRGSAANQLPGVDTALVGGGGTLLLGRG